MFQINVSDNTLIAIIVVSIFIFFIAVLIFIAIIYNIKNKYNSVNKYIEQQNPKEKTYEDNIREFHEMQYTAGIKNRKSPKIWQIIKKYFSDKINRSV